MKTHGEPVEGVVMVIFGKGGTVVPSIDSGDRQRCHEGYAVAAAVCSAQCIAVLEYGAESPPVVPDAS